jgi:hypothetical protein
MPPESHGRRTRRLLGEAEDPTTVAANPSYYQRFRNGAQPAFICEALRWNAGQAVRYLARGDAKPEGDLTAEQVYLQNLKKALWHIKREIMLMGGNPDDVAVPDPSWVPQVPQDDPTVRSNTVNYVPLDQPGEVK